MPSGGSASYGATATLGRVDREPSLLWVFHPKGLKLPLKSSELVPITLHARIQAYSRLGGVLIDACEGGVKWQMKFHVLWSRVFAR